MMSMKQRMMDEIMESSLATAVAVKVCEDNRREAQVVG
jgi:hypothetical protein